MAVVSLESSVGGEIWLECSDMRYYLDGGDGGTTLEILSPNRRLCKKMGWEVCEEYNVVEGLDAIAYLAHHVEGMEFASAKKWMQTHISDVGEWVSNA